MAAVVGIAAGDGECLAGGVMEGDEDDIAASEEVTAEAVEFGDVIEFIGCFGGEREGMGELSGLFAEDIGEGFAALSDEEEAGDGEREEEEEAEAEDEFPLEAKVTLPDGGNGVVLIRGPWLCARRELCERRCHVRSGRLGLQSLHRRVLRVP